MVAEQFYVGIGDQRSVGRDREAHVKLLLLRAPAREMDDGVNKVSVAQRLAAEKADCYWARGVCDR